MRERFIKVRQQLSREFVKRDDVIEALLISVALGKLGVNSMIIGTPGTGKSTIVRRTAQLLGLTYGELTLSNNLLPSGSLYSVNQVKLVRENAVELNLNSVINNQIVFLDELGRANDIMLNALIPYLLDRYAVMEEAPYAIETPTVTVVSATNFLPRDSRFDAVYDRFQLKVVALPPSPDDVEQIVELSIDRLASEVRDGIKEAVVRPLSREARAGSDIDFVGLIRSLRPTAKKFKSVVKMLYSAFKLYEVDGAGEVIISADDLPQDFRGSFVRVFRQSTTTYTVKASMRSLSFLPFALAFIEYLNGGITLEDIARVSTYFLTTPDKDFFPVLAPLFGGKSALYWKVYKILKDNVGEIEKTVYSNFEADLDAMNNLLRVMPAFLYAVKLARKVYGDQILKSLVVTDGGLYISLQNVVTVLSKVKDRKDVEDVVPRLAVNNSLYLQTYTFNVDGNLGNKFVSIGDVLENVVKPYSGNYRLNDIERSKLLNALMLNIDKVVALLRDSLYLYLEVVKADRRAKPDPSVLTVMDSIARRTGVGIAQGSTYEEVVERTAEALRSELEGKAKATVLASR